MHKLSALSASLYMLLLVTSFLLTLAGTIVYGVLINKAWIFKCDPGGYAPDHFLAYCDNRKFSDYEHAAYVRNLEPTAVAAVKSADVLILGNSRPQFAFSNHVLPDFFGAKNLSFYLLGFGYSESNVFSRELIEKIDARPRVVIINADNFFAIPESSAAADSKENDFQTLVEFGLKKHLQGIHTDICKAFPGLCPHVRTLYRDRATGAWHPLNFSLDQPVSVDALPKAEALDIAPAQKTPRLVKIEADANNMITWLEARGACVILTGVPSPGFDRRAAKRLAETLGVRHVFPKIKRLAYFDESHLTTESAIRYSQAFVRDLEPVLKSCSSN